MVEGSDGNDFYTDLRIDPAGEKVMMNDLPENPNYTEKRKILQVLPDRRKHLAYFTLVQEGEVARIVCHVKNQRIEYKNFDFSLDAHMVFVLQPGKQDDDRLLVQTGEQF